MAPGTGLEVFVSEFEIGKYPVTNLEFRAFVEGGGYETRDYWSEEGGQWLRGEGEPDLSYISDEELRRNVREWLEGRPVGKRRQPFFWEDARWNAPNVPVVGVTWYEATAYCNVTQQVAEIGRLLGGWRKSLV